MEEMTSQLRMPRQPQPRLDHRVLPGDDTRESVSIAKTLGPRLRVDDKKGDA